MSVIAVDRRFSGIFARKRTALGIAPPTPMPVRKRKNNGISTLVEVMVRNDHQAEERRAAMTVRLWPKRADSGATNR
jgi:hypothetical protein